MLLLRYRNELKVGKRRVTMEEERQRNGESTQALEEKKEEFSTVDGVVGTTKRISIDSLPNDAICMILGHCPDLDTLLNLASTSPTLRKTIYHQNLLTCDCCQTPLYLDECLSIAAPHTRPVSCSVCKKKLCGFTLFDYDKRHCKPQICDGCGAIECRQCMEAHLSNSDGYGTENYCEMCQEAFEFGMGGC